MWPGAERALGRGLVRAQGGVAAGERRDELEVGREPEPDFLSNAGSTFSAKTPGAGPMMSSRRISVGAAFGRPREHRPGRLDERHGALDHRRRLAEQRLQLLQRRRELDQRRASSTESRSTRSISPVTGLAARGERLERRRQLGEGPVERPAPSTSIASRVRSSLGERDQASRRRARRRSARRRRSPPRAPRRPVPCSARAVGPSSRVSPGAAFSVRCSASIDSPAVASAAPASSSRSASRAGSLSTRTASSSET